MVHLQIRYNQKRQKRAINLILIHNKEFNKVEININTVIYQIVFNNQEKVQLINCQKMIYSQTVMQIQRVNKIFIISLLIMHIQRINKIFIISLLILEDPPFLIELFQSLKKEVLEEVFFHCVLQQ
jgi:hypothetical protein